MAYTWKDVGDRPDKVLSQSEKEAIAAEWNRYEKEDKPVKDLEKLRNLRNSLLSQTDWTQNRDVTLSNDADWKTYRQKLRDITKTYKSLSDVKWPTAPKG
tara:strand:+ start:219 stop:518 length:300 start_codon:yes stop_codon:yes gene_type:complete